MTALPASLPSLSTREAIVDALYRNVIAYDTNDSALFESSLTPDAVFDLNGKIMNGIPEIKKDCFDIVGKLATTHFCTNIRIQHQEGSNTAHLTSTVLSEHFRPGEAADPASAYFTGGALYNIDLVRDGELWKISNFILKLIWSRGDRSVMSG